MRPDLLFGFFSSAAGVAAFARACNVGWLADWEMPGYAVSRAAACVDVGVKKLIVGVQYMLFQGSTYYGTTLAQANLRGMFDALRQAGTLGYVVAIYPVDEPDRLGVSEQLLTQVCKDIRQVLAGYSELAGCKLAVIYGSQGRVTPALASFDWAGFDDYDSGAAIFTNGMYEAFAAKLLPAQRAILVPGGASPWKQDPAPFLAVAESDARVGLIAPFIWINYGSPTTTPGIGSNGMAAAYLAAGAQVVGST